MIMNHVIEHIATWTIFDLYVGMALVLCSYSSDTMYLFIKSMQVLHT